MAGSKRWFKYTSDGGTAYSVILDESNAEATVNALKIVQNRTAAHPFLPCQIQMRYLLAFLDSDQKVRRKFWVGNPAAVSSIVSGANKLSADYLTAGSPEDWTITYYSGEREKVMLPLDTDSFDTGLDDADQGRDEA
jgi:hypothetical protein